MRSPALQYLYLQKPITTVIIICMVSVLPWLGMGDFATSEEAREASVASAMLHTGNWTLPEVYAGEYSHNPPLQHWLIALFSLPKGDVTQLSSRLPSAIAFFFLMGMTLSFFGQRIRFQQAFITVLLLLSCIGIHFTAMIAGVYMLFTTLVVIALFEMFKWEEKQELKGLPFPIPLLLSGAILTKGLIGLFLPLIVFGIYLVALKKYDVLRITKALAYLFVSSLFLPAIWCFAAWRQGGADFTQILIAENYGVIFDYSHAKQFIDSANPQKVSYIGTSLLGGFMPWTLLALLSVFTLWTKRKKTSGYRIRSNSANSHIGNKRKVKLLAVICIIVSLVLFSIPISKRAPFLLVTYPFIALFLAQYFIYLSANKAFITRLFAAILSIFSFAGAIVFILTMTGTIDPADLAARYTDSQPFFQIIENIKNISAKHPALTITLLVLMLIASGTVFYQLFKKINIKIIYASIFLAFTVNVLTDSVFIRGIRKGSSSKPFARAIKAEYPNCVNNTYVVTDHEHYTPLYGMNFYMNQQLKNFDENPTEGYLLSTSDDFSEIIAAYGDAYTFNKLTASSYFVRDSKAEIILSYFTRK